MIKRKLILAIDFDGTIISGDWPIAKTLYKNSKEVINYLHDELNCEIIIWTCRCNGNGFNSLDNAINFLKDNDIHYDYINKNGSIMNFWDTDSRKIFADFYIDDKSFLFEKINWIKIKKYIEIFKLTHPNSYL